VNSRSKEQELAELSWKLRRTLSRVRLSEYKWLNRIMMKEVTDDDSRLEILRYVIERLEYSAKNPTVPTGLDDLDDILYGGIPEGYAILITSPPIDEKDFIIESFLRDGTNKNEVVLLVSTRLKGVTKKLVEENQGFNLMLCSPWADNMVQDASNVLKFHGVEDLTQLNISLKIFLRNIEQIKKSFNRVVLDIVSDALLMHETRVVRRWLMDLLTMFKYMEVSTLSMLDPGMHSQDEVRTLIDLFDGHIDISEKMAENEQKKILTIKRLYNKKYLNRILELNQVK
jgi:KaiC/GvpD/RAD55 family RecA-like ATPase